MDKSIKAARDMLGMSQAELCDLAGVPIITLRRLEGNKSHEGLVSDATVQGIKNTLEARGIQFLEAGQIALGDGVALVASDDDA